MIDYTLIAGVILYFLTLRWVLSLKLSFVTAAAVVVIGSFVISLLPKAILASAHGTSLGQLVDWRVIVTIILQLLVASIVFRIIQVKEDSYAAWLGWGLLGFYAIFFLAPLLASALKV